MANESESETYNWDNIQVGQLHLNHSENFFDVHRQTQRPMVNNQIDKENNRKLTNQNVGGPVGLIAELDKLTLTVDKTGEPLKSNGFSSHQPDSTKMPAPSSGKTPRKPLTRAQALQPATKPKNALTKPTTDPCPPLLYQLLQKPPQQSNEVYKAKKERKMKHLHEQEKKMREFHSKPAPNFSVSHRKMTEKLEQKKTLPCCPITPKTLKNSTAAAAATQRKVEEYQQRKAEVPVFVANSADVVYQRPYKPKLEHRHIQQEPFQLRMSARLLERKEYDLQYERACEEKRLKEQQLKASEEKQVVKLLRRQKEFKANPNPFT